MNTSRPKTILIVEDNEDNLVVYRTILEHVGYRVIEARDGEEGVDFASRDHPDLILMDISIPKIDGWEATRRIKAEEETRDIPIIALTAHALEEDREKARRVGCDGYLAKPVEPRRVVEEVERFILNGDPAESPNGGPAETLNEGQAETLNEGQAETLNEGQA